jgi:hypothetical protein
VQTQAHASGLTYVIIKLHISVTETNLPISFKPRIKREAHYADQT